MSVSERLRGLIQEQRLEEAPTEWGQGFEESLVSVLIEKPELFDKSTSHLTPHLFQSMACMFVMAQIATDYEEHGVVPTRSLLRSRLSKQLTVDDPYEDILRLVDRKPSLREVPFVIAELNRFVGSRILSRLHSDELLELMASKDAPLIAAKVTEIYAEYDRFRNGDAQDSFSAAELLTRFPEQRPREGQERARRGSAFHALPESPFVGVVGWAMSCHRFRPWRQGGISFAFREAMEGGRSSGPATRVMTTGTQR